jgi:hypothetical protein
MIELPTLETDKFFLRNGYPTEVDTSKAMLLCEKLEQERDWAIEKYKLLESCFKRAERERDEARRKLEDLDVAAIHTCHDQCQRPMCVLRRERDELLDRNAKLRDIADRALMLNQSQ